ncbi:hypothetical protein GA0116948_101570 [Chitinophaga costaii]|uniref:Uncharacterized protein n=1 Tax=Chitinophaga costaii TaxID=1335309 RepID=A0A1C3ZVN9_9BACT|nr:hypothetical protein GA0116948_101570 [Chitinophaga costaii]
MPYLCGPVSKIFVKKLRKFLSVYKNLITFALPNCKGFKKKKFIAYVSEN